MNKKAQRNARYLADWEYATSKKYHLFIGWSWLYFYICSDK